MLPGYLAQADFGPWIVTLFDKEIECATLHEKGFNVFIGDALSKKLDIKIWIKLIHLPRRQNRFIDSKILNTGPETVQV